MILELETYVVSEVKTNQICQKVPKFLCARSSIIKIAHNKALFSIFDEFALQKSVLHLLQVLQESRKC